MRNIGMALFGFCLAVSGCTSEGDGGIGQGKQTEELASCGGFVPNPQTCAAGYICVDRSPDCTMALDCPGVCVEETTPQRCGGFAGIQCPGDLVCVDDPSDDCDPQNGGADCGGICVEKTDPKPQMCGGFAGIQCPSGLTCVDDPSDDCDPQHGGADCSGICVQP